MGAYIHRRTLQNGASPNFAFIFAFAMGGKGKHEFLYILLGCWSNLNSLNTLQRETLALLSKGLARVICDWQIVYFFSSRKWTAKMIDGENSILFSVRWWQIWLSAYFKFAQPIIVLYLQHKK